MKGFNAAVRMVTVGVLVGLAGPVAAQQTYPSKPIRLIAAYPPGGGTDIVARSLAQKLTESLGQPVIVDNRPGGNTIIGTDALAKSPPDGYTFLCGGADHVLVPLLLKTPYDPIKDFAPIATIAKSEFVLLINPALPAKDLKELIAYVKSRPGELNYATPAAGGMNHLVHEVLNLLAEIKMQHIPYKRGGPAIAALLAGEVQMHFSTTSPAVPLINSARLRAIAVTGDTRIAALPQVPTFIEAGLPGVSKVGSFYGVFASAGTPKPIVDKVSAEIAKHLVQPDFRDKLISQGLTPFVSTPEQFAALLKERLAIHADIIKKANIKFEN